MTGDAREVLRELLAARNEQSAERAAQMLAPEVRYWDAQTGDVDGRREVAEVLTVRPARFDAETVATAGADAVMEVRVRESGGSYRSTEVYRVESGTISSLKAYFDPRERPT